MVIWPCRNYITIKSQQFCGLQPVRGDDSRFEQVKHIYQYRTPRTLRAFSDFLITVLPMLYGPYFAHISKGFSVGLTYVMPVLFAPVLVSPDNIQEHLENPFDQVGQDDVSINAAKFVDRLQAGAPNQTA